MSATWKNHPRITYEIQAFHRWISWCGGDSNPPQFLCLAPSTHDDCRWASFSRRPRSTNHVQALMMFLLKIRIILGFFSNVWKYPCRSLNRFLRRRRRAADFPVSASSLWRSSSDKYPMSLQSSRFRRDAFLRFHRTASCAESYREPLAQACLSLISCQPTHTHSLAILFVFLCTIMRRHWSRWSLRVLALSST